MDYDGFYSIIMTFSVTVTLIVMLAACLCCRRKIPKNEFQGLEGMVKLKNPEDCNSVIVTETHNPPSPKSNSRNDLNLSIATPSTANGGGVELTDREKRASSAPHRSLPDIPIAEAMNDNGSDLYATVADKVHEKPQGRSPTPTLKKETSVSQHSSISQADDVSSPYARVKTPPHDYDKVRNKEHPYAQLNVPSTSAAASSNQLNASENSSNENVNSRRGSHQSLLGDSGAPEAPQEIEAASAIAGMVSASQELPYMTPPIVQQPHFSGDSQDSSKGYTSISVREPLANILAQTKIRHPRLAKEGSDSHYATVSDDSDEMYAAIEDPNAHADIYTSGSETYAQIQPANAITVAVEINTCTSSSRQHHDSSEGPSPRSTTSTSTLKAHGDSAPVPPPVDSLRAQMHSRQASSSSNTSSMGNLGSPKPEKRSANSPLPPTPKSSQFASSNSNLTSTSSRNSVASVIEVHLPLEGLGSVGEDFTSPGKKKKFSPSKDIEGMYAKVMKKNKFSSVPSQSSSPVLSRKVGDDSCSSSEIPPVAGEELSSLSPSKSISSSRSTHDVADRLRERELPCRRLDLDGAATSSSTTDPAEICKITIEPGYESLPDQSALNSDHGYETLLKTDTGFVKKPNSDYDPNYEVLQPPKYTTTGSDDGYAKVMEKKPRIDDEDANDGYSKVKEPSTVDDDNVPGYSRIGEPQANHDYASISEASRSEAKSLNNNNNNNDDETESDIYSKIQNDKSTEDRQQLLTTTTTSPSTSHNSPERLSTMKASSTSNTISSGQQMPSSNYESLTGSESDPNYESVRYLDTENPYERLNDSTTVSPDMLGGSITPLTPSSGDLKLSTPSHSHSEPKSMRSSSYGSPKSSENGEVDDYFQV